MMVTRYPPHLNANIATVFVTFSKKKNVLFSVSIKSVV